MQTLAPFRLAPFFSPRVWGRPNLRPWYPETGTSELVGEAWLTGPDSLIETGPFTGRTLASVVAEHPALLNPAHATAAPEFPLLIKLLFPNDKLSVQVHPDDAQAHAIGQPRGKTECWYVLEAEPGATVALGLKPNVTLEALAASAADNTMEDLIEQVPVSVGDMVFVDAGTIHAIGPGVVLLETQQTSDTTYRLYDYGRPRPLHLEDGLKVLRTHTDAGKVTPQSIAQQNGTPAYTRLIAQKYFTVDRIDVPARINIDASSTTALPYKPGLSSCLITLSGTGILHTDAGSVELQPSKAVLIPATSTNLRVESTEPLALVLCTEPA